MFTPFRRAWDGHGWPRPRAAPDGRDLVAGAGDADAGPDELAPDPAGVGAALPGAGEAAAADSARPRSAPDRSPTTRRTGTGPTSRARRGSRPTCASAPSTPARCWPGSPAGPSGEAFRVRTGVAGVLRRRAVAPARLGLGAAPARRGPPALGHRSRGRRPVRGVGRRSHRVPAGRRRHAPAGRRGVDAQPGADADGLVPGQGPPPRLAPRGRPTSSTCWSTATWPPTTTAGSGWPAPAPTPHRSTGCSAPTARPSGSTRTGPTWPGTCPSTATADYPDPDRRPRRRAGRGPGPVGGGQARGGRPRRGAEPAVTRIAVRGLRPHALLPAPLRLLRLRHLHRPGPPDGGLRRGLRHRGATGPSSARACRRPRSVFFGGGTPSRLPADLLASVLDAVPRRAGAEVTVECNPEDVDPGACWPPTGPPG